MKKSELKHIIREILIEEGFALGSSHGCVSDNPEDNGASERDHLNYTELTDKMGINEQYRFEDAGKVNANRWPPPDEGFGELIKVYHGTIFLGMIESHPDGYSVEKVAGPHNLHTILITNKSEPLKKRTFRTKNEAAERVHFWWKQLRKGKL